LLKRNLRNSSLSELFGWDDIDRERNVDTNNILFFVDGCLFRFTSLACNSLMTSTGVARFQVLCFLVFSFHFWILIHCIRFS